MNDMPLKEVAERLGDMADATDRESTGPMYLGQHARSGLINVPIEDATAMRQAASIVRKVDAGELTEVAHGKWLNFVGDFSTAECDKCSEIYEVSPDEKPCEDYFNAFKQFYKFRPSCGARMDGEGDRHG